MKVASWVFFIFVIVCFDWFNICSPDIWNAVAEYGFRLLAAEFIAKTWPFWLIDSSFLAINILNKSNNLDTEVEILKSPSVLMPVFEMVVLRKGNLSKKNYDKSLHILADVKKEIKKTKEFNSFLEKNKINNVLIISDNDSLKNIHKSARNIKNLKIIKDEGTNVYDLFKYKNILITSSSAKKIQNRILNEKN